MKEGENNTNSFEVSRLCLYFPCHLITMALKPTRLVKLSANKIWWATCERQASLQQDSNRFCRQAHKILLRFRLYTDQNGKSRLFYVPVSVIDVITEPNVFIFGMAYPIGCNYQLSDSRFTYCHYVKFLIKTT